MHFWIPFTGLDVRNLRWRLPEILLRFCASGLYAAPIRPLQAQEGSGIHCISLAIHEPHWGHVKAHCHSWGWADGLVHCLVLAHMNAARMNAAWCQQSAFYLACCILRQTFMRWKLKKKTVDCIVCQQIGLKRPWHNYGMIMHRRLGKEGAEEVQWQNWRTTRWNSWRPYLAHTLGRAQVHGNRQVPSKASWHQWNTIFDVVNALCGRNSCGSMGGF